MIEELVDLHKGARIAVLGSGPSLRLFTGQQPVAIAVNGAAFHRAAYQYFVCGDIQSPLQDWFYASRDRKEVKRVIASFLTSVDRELYDDEARRRVQEAVAPAVFAAAENRSQKPLYDFIPPERPRNGHLWFRYAVDPLPADREAFLASMRDRRLLHGGTIAGVAVQLAYLMGASEVHLWGCSMDNDSGGNYADPRSNGRTTDAQRRNLASLLRLLKDLGISIEIHGPSRLTRLTSARFSTALDALSHRVTRLVGLSSPLRKRGMRK
jgi:hypothetical protein